MEGSSGVTLIFNEKRENQRRKKRNPMKTVAVGISISVKTAGCVTLAEYVLAADVNLHYKVDLSVIPLSSLVWLIINTNMRQ